MEIQILKECDGRVGDASIFQSHSHLISPPLPDLSGKQRFHGYLDMLAKNLRKGESILSDLPLPELDTPKESTLPPQKGDAVQEAVPTNHTYGAAKAKEGASKQTAPASAPNGARDWALFEPSGEK